MLIFTAEKLHNIFIKGNCDVIFFFLNDIQSFLNLKENCINVFTYTTENDIKSNNLISILFPNLIFSSKHSLLLY